MREEEKVVNYRPNLAEQMQETLDTCIKFYSENPILLYMLILMNSHKDASVRGISEKCFNDLNKKGWISDDTLDTCDSVGFQVPTQAQAAKMLFNIYEKDINSMCDALYNIADGTNKLTIVEKNLIKEFKQILTGPVRNPNLEIHKDSMCWYDLSQLDYLKETDISRNFIKDRCKHIVAIFNTED
jgi:hypothetical protein